MEKSYWLRREHQALAAAAQASAAEIRLIHLELARRHGLAAAAVQGAEARIGLSLAGSDGLPKEGERS